MSSTERGVVLMALGGPSSLDEVEPYLRDLREGRETPPELVAEFRERYRRIGGRTPLIDISLAQARALEERLAATGPRVPCTVGMRHSAPRIADAVRDLVGYGVREIVGICLTPYYSSWSVGGYLATLRQAVDASGSGARVVPVESWNIEPGLVRAFTSRVERGLHELASRGVADPVVLFTAHSLPGIADPSRDPYVLGLAETRRLIEAALPPLRSRLAYQSVGRRAGPWLGPSAETVLEELAAAHERGVLVVPFGFVSDNLEILYDVDIEFRALAERGGLAFARTPSPNADPDLADALAHAARSAGTTA
jgi:ferrochelatase